MSSLLDIIGAHILGGVLLVMLFNIVDSTNKYFFTYNDDLIVQQNLTNLTETLEFDLKKMGFAVPEGDNVIVLADSTHLIFRGDVNKDWVPDTVEYYVGTPADLSGTPNPDDHPLYRKLNGLPANGFLVGTVTLFEFEYLDQDGLPVDVSSPANYMAIKMVRITLKIENTAVYSSESNPEKSEYRTAFWQQTRLVSRNLRR